MSVLAPLQVGLDELGLPQAQWQRVAPMSNRRRLLRRGEVLFAAGEAPTSLYEVQAGCFKTSVTGASGREQVAGFQVVGDFVGLDGFNAERRHSEGLALQDSMVNVVPFAVLSQLSGESPHFQHHLHKLLGREVERGRTVMFLLGSMSAMERVATFLLDLLQRLSHRGHSATAVNLCMTREEIGSYLGLTLETVSRMFGKLKHDGTLDVENRQIRILDQEALRRAAAGLN